jgi:hypothetical protein
MSREQNTGRYHNFKTVNKTFENVEKYKCLETTLTNQHHMLEEIYSMLNSGNAS